MDADSAVRRLESRSYRTPREKRDLLQALGDHPLRAGSILKFLTGGDSELARFAMGRVSQCRDGRLLDQLLHALPGAGRGIARVVIEAIHRMRSPRLGERMGKMLRSPKLEPRAVALEVLGTDPGWKQHLSLLKLALRDDERAIRVQAVKVLGADVRDVTVRGLLHELLYSTDEDVRHAAIEVLARDPDPSLIADFFELLPNQPPRLQEIMVRGLRRMLSGGAHDERVLEHIMPLLAADDENMRTAAAQLLASMPDKLYVLRRFFQYAKGIAFWLRDRAFTAVAAIAGDVTEAILDLMREDDVDVVVGAVAMAGGTRDPRIVDGLAALLDTHHDWWIKIPALEHLAAFEQPRVHDMLVARLDDEELRHGAIAALGRRGDRRALPHLLPFLTHARKGLRRAALDALAGFRGEPGVLPGLERVAREDADGECRIVALELLDESGAEGVAAAAAVRGAHQKAAPGAADDVALTMFREDPVVD